MSPSDSNDIGVPISVKRDTAPYAESDLQELAIVQQDTGYHVYPHWVAQPYIRALPKLSSSGGAGHMTV